MNFVIFLWSILSWLRAKEMETTDVMKGKKILQSDLVPQMVTSTVSIFNRVLQGTWVIDWKDSPLYRSANVTNIKSLTKHGGKSISAREGIQDL
jgi:hypothetical protein